jgi:hypothetical protein
MSECQMKRDGDGDGDGDGEGERNYARDFMGGMLYLLIFEVLPIPNVMALKTPAAPTTHRMPPIERRATTCRTKVPNVRQ